MLALQRQLMIERQRKREAEEEEEGERGGEVLPTIVHVPDTII